MLPPEQMRELYDIAKGAGAKDVTWVDFEEAHHMSKISTTCSNAREFTCVQFLSL